MNNRITIFCASVFVLSLLLAGETTAAVRDDGPDRPVAGATAEAAPIRFAQTHNPQPESRPRGATGAASAATAGKQGSSGAGATGAVNSAVRNWAGLGSGKQAGRR